MNNLGLLFYLHNQRFIKPTSSNTSVISNQIVSSKGDRNIRQIWFLSYSDFSNWNSYNKLIQARIRISRNRIPPYVTQKADTSLMHFSYPYHLLKPWSSNSLFTKCFQTFSECYIKTLSNINSCNINAKLD